MSSTEAFKSFRCEAEVLLKGIKEKHLATINQVERVLVSFSLHIKRTLVE